MNPSDQAELNNSIEWEYTIPLATNRFILFDLGKRLTVTYLVILFVFLSIGGLVNNLALAIEFCIAFFWILLGLAVLVILIMVFFYENRLAIRFSLKPEGVESIIQPPAILENPNLFVQWIRRKNTDSSTPIPNSKKSFYTWRKVRKVKYHPNDCAISLFTSFNLATRLYLPAKQYPQAVAYIERSRLDSEQ